MKNKNWYAVVTLVALLTLSGAAFAHDMDKDGGRHHHMMCESGGFKKDKAVFKKMHALHEKLHTVLVAPEFDKKAFLALSGQIEQLRSQMMKHHAEDFASRLAKMSPEEREKMMQDHHGFQGHHKHRECHGHEHGDHTQRHNHIEWNDHSDDYSHLNQ